MRRPARIEPWMSTEEMAMWVRGAPDKEALKRRLAIWLTHIRPFHAHEVATMLQVSKPAVWQWIRQYNRLGPLGLNRKGRGGRRWSYLTLDQEAEFLKSLHERAAKGEILTANQIHPELCKLAGREVSIHYVYRLLHRHGWRKMAPRPHHVKRDKETQESFKKTSQKSSGRSPKKHHPTEG